ncbi:MAG: hypothetical protein ACRD7F_05075 [Nitrososphaeraceae archaeon]|jgi:hypothetical protein
MNKTTISVTLLGISLILLIIYGMDVLAASTTSPEGAMGQGFLPVGEQVRGIVFGGGAVAMSIIAFIISRKVPSIIVSVLLFINGGLIIVGIIVTVVQANLSSEEMANMGRTAGSTVLFGLLLIGLGIWKIITDRKVLSKQHPS